MKRGHRIVNRQVWTATDEKYLREHYANLSTKELAETLQRTIFKIYRKAAGLGLAKSSEYLSDPANRCRLPKGSRIGVASQFCKGQVPVNKGVRRPGWGPGRMKATQFKKGSRPHTWKPVGTILTDGEGYLRIKIRERRPEDKPGWRREVWPLLSWRVWEQHNGRPVPPKHIVVFRDRDRSNCDIKNLELISKADNARRNAMWGRYPPELCSTIMLAGALKRRIRKLDGKKQD